MAWYIMSRDNRVVSWRIGTISFFVLAGSSGFAIGLEGSSNCSSTGGSGEAAIAADCGGGKFAFPSPSGLRPPIVFCSGLSVGFFLIAFLLGLFLLGLLLRELLRGILERSDKMSSCCSRNVGCRRSRLS